MKKYISKFLSSVDLLGTYPQLYINKGYTYSTLTGGVISLFVWAGILYALFAYSIEVLFVRTPNVINYSTLRSNVPIFNISAKENFEFIILLLDKNNKIVNPDENIIDIRYQNYHTFYKTEDDGEVKVKSELAEDYEFGVCSQDMKNKMKESFNNYIDKTLPDLVMCPQYDIDKERKVGGSLIFSKEIYQSKIVIRPKCTNFPTCTSEEISAFKNYTSLTATQAMLAINYFIPNPKDVNPKINTFKQTMANMKKTSNKITINFAEVSMLTDNNYLPLIGSADHSTFFTVEGVYNSFSSQGDEIDTLTTEFVVDMVDFVNIYERYYPKIDSIITRFFSFYLYCLYVGTIVKGCLYTYNLERYLINSTLINENSIQIKLEDDKSGDGSNNSSNNNDNNSGSGGKRRQDKESEFNLRSDSIYDNTSSISSIHNNILDNNLKTSLVSPSQKEVEEMSKYGSNNFAINAQKSLTNSADHSLSVDKNKRLSDSYSDFVILSQTDNKMIKLRRIYDTIKEKKVKLSLRERYSCSSHPESFKTNINYLYKVLDARNIIKFYLQFEKMKQIVFSEKQKLVFELFAVDVSFLDNKLYNKNIEDMTDEEIKIIIESLEAINEEHDDISKSLIKLLPSDFKKILFNE